MTRIYRFGFLLFLGFLWGCIDEPADLQPVDIKEEFRYFSMAQGLADYEIFSLFEDSKGNIWIGHYLGVSRYNGTSFQNFSYPNIIDGPIEAIGEDMDGDIWVGNGNGYSLRINNQWYTEEGFPVTSFYLDKTNGFWIGTIGLGALRLKNGELDQFTDDCPSCNWVTGFQEDASGNMWYSTYGAAYRFSGSTRQKFYNSEGLLLNYVQRIGQDHWGNMMFGGFYDEAIFLYRQGAFKPLILPTDASDISGIAHDGVRTYVSSFDAGLLYYDGTVMGEILTPKEDFNVNCVLVDSKGFVWIGTAEEGVIRYKPSYLP
jgi:ligand-binding sensor domain-containing protein